MLEYGRRFTNSSPGATFDLIDRAGHTRKLNSPKYLLLKCWSAQWRRIAVKRILLMHAWFFTETAYLHFQPLDEIKTIRLELPISIPGVRLALAYY